MSSTNGEDKEKLVRFEDHLVLQDDETESPMNPVEKGLNAPSEKSKAPLFQGHRKLVLVSSTAAFCENVMISAVGPFFPLYAEERYGASVTTVGMIICLFPLTVMLASPLFGLVIYRFGRLKTSGGGLMMLALGTLLFGLADSVWQFFLARFIQGLGSAALNVGFLALMVDYIADDELGTAMGLQEGAVGVGFMVGPVAGGGLHALLGFRAAFVALGCLPAAMSLALPGLLDPRRYRRRITSRTTSSDEDKASIRKLLTGPGVVCMVVTTISLGCMGFLEPTFAAHLRATLGLDEVGVGLAFALPSLVYALAAVRAGPLADRVGYRNLVCAGIIELGLCYYFLGPVPWAAYWFTSRAVTWTMFLIGLVLLGTGFAHAIVPMLPLLKGSCEDLDSRRAQDIIASLFSSACSAGEFLGPLIGGLLVDYVPQLEEVTCKLLPTEKEESPCFFGFQWASFLFGTILVFLAPVIRLLVPRPSFLTNEDDQDPTKATVRNRNHQQHSKKQFSINDGTQYSTLTEPLLLSAATEEGRSSNCHGEQ